MSDYLKEILSKKNLINILILAILVLAIPLTINLVRQQQILFSKAATDTVQLVDNLCTIVQNNKKVLTCPTLNLNFVAPSEVDVISAQGLVSTAYAATGCDSAYDGQTLSGQDQSVIDSFRATYWDGAEAEWIRQHNTQLSGSPPKATDNQTLFDQQCSVIYSFYGTYSSNAPAEWVNQHNVVIGTSSPTHTPVPPAASCPVTASCCVSPLQTCGTTSSFNPTTAIDTSCPTGFQWCYSGYCISEKYDNKGTTGSCLTSVAPPNPQVCTQSTSTTPNFDAQNCRSCASDGSFWGANGSDYGTNFNSPEWCSCARRFAQDYQSNTNYTSCRASAPPVASLTGPSSIIKQNNKWPDLTFQVSADSSIQWGVYYQNGSTCTLSSCSLEGWTPLGTGTGNGSVTWVSSQANLQNVPAGTHTFAVINNPPTRVLFTTDVNFTATPALVITKVRYAQNRSDLTNPNIRKEIAYQAGGVREDITLTDTSVGTKFVFAQFIDDKGQTTDANPFPFQIDLVGPSPVITGFSCEVDITKTDNSSDLLFKFAGSNFGSAKGTITLGDGTSVNNIDSWSNIFVSARLNNPPLSQTAVGTQYTATLTTKDGQKSLPQQCRVGITQISLGAKLFCRKEMNFDADNIDLTLILDKDHAQKSREKVTIDKDGNITDIKTKLKSGESYIACIKAPLSLRKCSGAFTALVGNNILTIDLPVGDYNGDGAINNFDKSILQSQWGPMNTSKNCDVNRDGACNSFEWSCMLHDFNAGSQKEPS